MDRIWEDENDAHKGIYIARVTHQYDYYFVAGNEKDVLVVRKEHALGIADALQKSEGVDLRADLAAMTTERDRILEKYSKLNGILNYLKLHIDYVMDGDENTVPEKFWLYAMSQFIERETAALESEDK